MGRFWYSYNGSGDPLSASSYNVATNVPMCVDGCKVCAIYAVGSLTPTAPLSTNIRQYIATGLLRLKAQPESPPAPAGSMLFVFFRNC